MPTRYPADDADPPERTALLWDLDNVAPPREHLVSLARALCCLVAMDEPVIAAGHRVTFRACREPLAELGYRVLSGGRRSNGADQALLREARALADQGVRRLLVASNDGRFAQIAAFADLHVLSLTGDYVSQRLRVVAHTVSAMSFSLRGWERRDAIQGNQSLAPPLARSISVISPNATGQASGRRAGRGPWSRENVPSDDYR